MTVIPRILFVHAHPDDETITTGGTIAALVGEGAQVTVLSATRGEAGEVIPSELRDLEGDRAGLARVREAEIAEAMAALGVREHLFLGGSAHSFEDSGMEWGADGHAVAAAAMPANALCAAELSTVARYIAAVIDEVRPHAVITYAANGGYGHPDHVRVHEATVAAVDTAAWRTGRLLFVDVPAEVAHETFDANQPGFAETGFSPAQTIPTKPPVSQIVVAQDISTVIGVKRAALAAHRTQVSVSGGFFALSNGIGMKIVDHEYYSISAGAPISEQRLSSGPAPHVLTDLDIAACESQHPGVAGAAPLRRRREPKKPGFFAYAHAAVLALLIGFLGAMQHMNVSVFDLWGAAVILPWGLVLALLLVACGLWHLKTMYLSSTPMLVAAFVIVILSYVLGQPQWLPGSDIIVTGTLRSAAWLIGPMLIAAVLAFIKVRRPEAAR
ncbi:N-acetyl-1-D-myo-inositol-2-amino-2-deoxy-alpha-D-glucopyranoside deacetylase [Brevibacterium sandarakinum]|uniref:N-acetyl-1-D-myo-inositol-2-amino-2-deoxy-alpha-D-glucopyranoside deacetylase n=2 Tax=Brevibacterium sandarakinum TaxID=629680 RepID=A0A1H1L6R7_BRESA|nr:N-acetyl-1-D-myo-inositol-2-amino-2-deoxy-alpha-D-glucopyranoside deacetylase [Brevibacterium sandarakinum]